MNVCSSKHNTLFYQLRDNFTRNLENGTISQIQSFRLWVCLGGPGCQCRFGIEEKEFVLEELSVSRNGVGVEANEASESKTSEGSRTTAPQQRSTLKRRNSFLHRARLTASRATSRFSATFERRSVRTHVMWFMMLHSLSMTASKGVYRVAKKKIEELFGTARTSEFGLYGCQYSEWFLNEIASPAETRRNLIYG